MYRIGLGIDVHPLVKGYSLILGGVKIPYSKGLKGHSDADVLIHAVMDAILGAICEGDIGQHFPDSDPLYKGISSLKLLGFVEKIMKNKGYRLHNLDVVVIAQEPKLAPYFKKMKRNLSATLNVDLNSINFKATTTEMLGFPGRGEGIMAEAVVLLFREGK